VKSRISSQRNETFLVKSVRPGKKFGFQSAAENLHYHSLLYRTPRLMTPSSSSHGDSLLVQRGTSPNSARVITLGLGL